MYFGTLQDFSAYLYSSEAVFLVSLRMSSFPAGNEVYGKSIESSFLAGNEVYGKSIGSSFLAGNELTPSSFPA